MSDWPSAIAAVASAIAGIAAAVAAFRSARSAEDSRRLAEAAELRAQLREASYVAATSAAEHARLQSLALRLKSALRSNAVAVGGLGGSRQKLAETQVDDRLAKASELLKVFEPFRNGASSLKHTTTEDADRVLHDQRLALTQLQVIASELATDLDATQASGTARLA